MICFYILLSFTYGGARKLRTPLSPLWSRNSTFVFLAQQTRPAFDTFSEYAERDDIPTNVALID